MALLHFLLVKQYNAPNKVKIRLNDQDRVILADKGDNLLDVLEKTNINIEAGCRMGACGADPVQIIEGADKLDPPSNTEMKTLKRLSSEAHARMACCSIIKGDIDISFKKTNIATDVPTEKEQSGISEKSRIIIIGNGIAGNIVDETISQSENNSNYYITTFTDENYPFYNRMGIIRMLYNQRGINDIDLSDVNRAEHLHVNTVIKSIDTDKAEITTALNKQYNYDILIFATGSFPFKPDIPGVGLPGIFTVNSVDDILSARKHIQSTKIESAAIWGGGILGIEMASILNKVGAPVIIYHRDKFLLNRNIDKASSAILQTLLSNMEINTSLGVSISSIKKQGDKLQLILDNGGSHTVDMLFICLGFRPNCNLAKETNILVDKGINVNAQQQTNVENVYAVGACCQFDDGRIPVLWEEASISAERCAQAILGLPFKEPPVTDVPFIAKIKGVDLVSQGIIESDIDTDEVLIYVDESNHIYQKLVIRKGVIIGYILLNCKKISTVIKKLHETKTDISDKINLLRDVKINDIEFFT